jgi:hypothetical protein
MFSYTKSTLALAFSVFAAFQLSDGFAPQGMSCRCSTALNAEASRRAALLGIIGAVGASLVGSPEMASARYSTYAHREQDWEERKMKGEVNFKTAKDLRSVRSN